MPKPKSIKTVILRLLAEGYKSTLQNSSFIFNSQQGIAQLLVLLLLVAGIGVGTYLVNQRTNLLPKAATGVVEVVSNTDTAIQTALDSIKTTGGAVHLPAGTYNVTKKIRLYNNTTLFGDGIDKTIINGSGITGSDSVLGNDTSAGQKNIIIRDLTVMGGPQEGMKIRNLDGGYIYNIKVDGAKVGILLGFHNGKGVTNVRVSNCTVINNQGAGIDISLGDNNVIDNCTFENNTKSSDSSLRTAAIWLGIGVDGTISSNKVINNQVRRNGNTGIALQSTYSGGTVSNNAVCYNTVEDNDDVGIADLNGKNNLYISNTIKNNKDRGDGKIVICDADNNGCQDIGGDFNGATEKLPPATDARCDIPSNLANLPSMTQGSTSGSTNTNTNTSTSTTTSNNTTNTSTNTTKNTNTTSNTTSNTSTSKNSGSSTTQNTTSNKTTTQTSQNKQSTQTNSQGSSNTQSTQTSSGNTTDTSNSPFEGIKIPFGIIKLGKEDNIDDIRRRTKIAFENYNTFAKILAEINRKAPGVNTSQAQELINQGRSQANACINQ